VRTIGSVLLVLLFPIVWGLLSAWAFDHLRARWADPPEDEDAGEGEEQE